MKRILLASALFFVFSSFAAIFSQSVEAACITNLQCAIDHTIEGCQLSADKTTYECITGPLCSNGNGINTAIGCIPINDTNAFIGFILGWAIGIGGGIAFLLIIYAGFMIMTSSGNPDRLKAGQELLTSAIAGLIMLIFSVFILRVIGVNILGVFSP